MCLAIATYPRANSVSATVANRKPAGAPKPLPNPTAIGTLPVMAVMGAALATAMRMTATMPTAPFFRPAGAGAGAAEISLAADSVVTAGLPVRIGVHFRPATLQFRCEPRILPSTRQPERRYFLPTGRFLPTAGRLCGVGCRRRGRGGAHVADRLRPGADGRNRLPQDRFRGGGGESQQGNSAGVF